MCRSRDSWFNWKGGYYFCQVIELIAIWAGIFTTSWLRGSVDPVPWIKVAVKIGLIETCLSWEDFSVCAADGEVLNEFADFLERDLSFIQRHTFDIPLGFLYTVIFLHFLIVFVLFSVHPLWLPRGINILQLLLSTLSLCWFGLSSFKKNMCAYIDQCYFGFSLYLVVGATVLCFLRLIFHFYKFHQDGEDMQEWTNLSPSPSPRCNRSQSPSQSPRRNQSSMRNRSSMSSQGSFHCLESRDLSKKRVELIMR